MKQTRQPVRAIKQSINLDVYDTNIYSYLVTFTKILNLEIAPTIIF